MNLGYILPRVIRHFLPMRLSQALLRRKIIIRPGLETRQPEAATERYQADLKNAGIALAGKRVLVFGYGGSFAVGCGLLRAGAREVILCDKYAPPDDDRNRALIPECGDYLVQKSGQVLPKTESLKLLEADIREVAAQNRIEPVDIVVSTSVYEHLDDVEGITNALAAITQPKGTGLHYVDLRDHFFRYPFAMLCYSPQIWRSWLNPGTNLNRYRLWNYRKAFSPAYLQVEIEILQQDRPAFERVKHQIRPEYVSGQIDEDCATFIRVLARGPVSSISGSG